MSIRRLLALVLAVSLLVLTFALPSPALAGEREDEEKEFFEEFEDEDLFFVPRFGLLRRLQLLEELDDLEDLRGVAKFRAFGFRDFEDDD